MNNRCLAIFRTYQDSPNHDTIVSLIWRILKKADKDLATTLHFSNAKFKPFTWAYTQGTEGTLTFSAIDPKITHAFQVGCQIFKNSNVLVDTTVFVPVEIIPFENAEIIRDSSSSLTCKKSTITVTTRSPITVTNNVNGQKTNIFYQNDPVQWLSRLRKNLYQRTHTFKPNLPTIVIGEITIILQEINEIAERINYKKTIIPAYHAELRITAPLPYLETILYGGLGERTASGFGFVVNT